jgi:3-oxoacyl-[acyl-carrier protein] reductase
MQLQSKLVAITGAGKGIGRAMALAFAGKGANVALIDLNPADLDATRAQCAALGVRAERYVCNVSDESQVSNTCSAVVSDFGRFDVLINNAGITRDGLLVKVQDGKVVAKMTLEQWQAVINVNLTGVFLCAREAAERMITLKQGGVIVNISSISRSGNVGQTNYTAAKAGVAAMGVTWAKELARYGIRVGSIAPGFTRTEILSAMKPEILEKAVAPVPLKRLGEAEEIAHAAVFIAENDFFTGRTLEVDGGLRI